MHLDNKMLSIAHIVKMLYNMFYIISLSDISLRKTLDILKYDDESGK